jgi:hypothetical protein
MTTLGRRKIFLSAVVAPPLMWPLAQRLLVARFDVDPWRLGGWGMYSVPGRKYRIDLMVAEPPFSSSASPASSLRTLRRSEVSPEFLREFSSWRERRSVLGRLVPLSGIARRFFDTHPAFEVLEIREKTARLEPGTALMREVLSTHRFDRGQVRRS